MSTSANAGEIRARLVLSNDEFKRKMGDARGDIEKTSFSAQQLNEDFGKIQKASLIAVGGISAIVGGSVKIAAEFEQSMAQVQAISGSTAEEFARQEEAARKMGAETIFSASEAAEGMSYLAMAGFDVEQQIDTLPSVLNAAIAGNIGLGDSANIVTNIMSAFKLEAEESERAVDVLAQAANSANTDIPLMGEAFKMVAPVAEALGWSIEETAAAIGELGNVGISGSQAGTVLRASLLALANPTGQTKDAMEELGVEVLDAEGNMKSLPDLMGHISGKMEGMTDAQKTQAAAQLVGTQAASGFIALLEVGEEGLQDFTTELENSEGAAQEMADVQADTLTGSFKEFQSAMEEAGIKLGNEFLPMFRDIVEWGTKIVSSFDEVEIGQIKTALVFGGTTAAIALTITTIGKLVIAVRGLLASMGPAGWIITGLSVLGGLFATNALTSEDLSEKVERLGQEFDDLTSLDDKITEFDMLQKSSGLTGDEFARFVDLTDEINRTTNPEKLEALRKEQEELYGKSTLSNDELDRMVVLNGELVEEVPEATDAITEQGNAILESADALKEYSKEKLESLYTEMDITRLAMEQEYKKVLIEEAEIIEEKKESQEGLNDLKEERIKKEDRLREVQDELQYMYDNEQEYKTTEISLMEDIVAAAEEDLDLVVGKVSNQAESVLKHDEALEKVRETITEYEEMGEQMIAILLQQEGLTHEQGKGLQIVEDEIEALEKEKKKLQENTDEAHKNTDEYKDSLSAIDKKVKSLEGVKSKIGELTIDAGNLTTALGAAVTKPITYNYSHVGVAGAIAPHARGPQPSYHTGGIVSKDDLPPIKLHTGGLPRDLIDTPLHNEVDARLLQNEMVLTEGQQSNLWKMLDGTTSNKSTDNDYGNEMIALLTKLLEATEEGRYNYFDINARSLGSGLEPVITEIQRRKNNPARKGRRK